MQPSTNDNDLHALFADLRDEEAQQVPAFEAFWEETLTQREKQHRYAGWLRYAAAAVLLLGLSFSALFLFQPREAMSITEWQSPTARLLQPLPTMPDATTLPSEALMNATPPPLETYVPPTQTLWPDALHRQ